MRLISAAKALPKRHPAGVLQRSAYYFIFPTVVVTVTVQIMILGSTRFQEYSSWSWDSSEKTLPNSNDVTDHGLEDSLMPVCTDPCLWKAGIDGSDSPWVIPPGPYKQRTGGAHVPSKDAPFPWRTSWKWVDQQCSVDVMSYDDIYRVLKRLNIRHLLFYGDDSLTESHVTSFVNKMNSTNFYMDKEKDVIIKGVLTCQVLGDTVPYTIRILSERDKGGNDYPHWPRGVYRIKNSTKKFIQEANTDRMLAVFNIGAHYHNWTHYTEDIDVMIQLLEEANRTQDIYFF